MAMMPKTEKKMGKTDLSVDMTAGGAPDHRHQPSKQDSAARMHGRKLWRPFLLPVTVQVKYQIQNGTEPRTRPVSLAEATPPPSAFPRLTKGRCFLSLPSCDQSADRSGRSGGEDESRFYAAGGGRHNEKTEMAMGGQWCLSGVCAGGSGT
ncbi:hypothetical protein CBR_g29277 [Chara braunii]|uniref:Uncharacterized protein n=1 Tax=Chara braunii TaxID=69332 RepID=A0A388LA80_CHABU|nr:hypothetical protein CBR_g29277 [Chara braunii]|eukprot:GBG79225.1 hypothetical protein CBR_g29277 [Chara braunii]